MNSARRHTLLALVLSFLPLAALATTTSIVDPFNFFHRQPFATTRYFQTNAHTERQRLHAFGLIYTHIAAADSTYDGILVGSSRTTGMSTTGIAEALGLAKVADLSLIGSRGVENRALIERALATGRVTTVLWEIDYWFIDARRPATTTPPYLLTPTRLDDLRYFATPFVFGDALDLLTGRNPKDWSPTLDGLSNPTRFFSKPTFQLASSRMVESAKPIARATAYDPTKPVAFPRLDEDVIAVVRAHPELRFNLFFPVVPHLLYACEPVERFPAALAGRRYLLERVKDLPNVRVFAFDIDDLVAGNLANFSDPNHCGHGADDYLFECLATGRNELTLATIDAYERAFIERVDHFAPRSDPTTAIGYDPHWR